MEKIIFLDYDGVLNNLFYFVQRHFANRKISKQINHYKDDFDPRKVGILRKICQLTGAKVVVTSSWRFTKEARDFLISKGIPIIGITSNGEDKGVEIKEWIKKHDVSQYLILDDETSEFDEQLMPHTIQTRETFSDTLLQHFDYYMGLQEKHISWAVTILGEKKREMDKVFIVYRRAEFECESGIEEVFTKKDDAEQYANEMQKEAEKNGSFDEYEVQEWIVNDRARIILPAY